MLGLLALHIAALLLWSAMLLYLPALIAGAQRHEIDLQDSVDQHDSLARFLFTRLVTPAALVTILAGTLIFLLERNIAPWLILKLTLVAILVLCHAFIGMLVLRLESSAERPLQPWCTLVSLLVAGVLIAILWLVLAKPSFERLPWQT